MTPECLGQRQDPSSRRHQPQDRRVVPATARSLRIGTVSRRPPLLPNGTVMNAHDLARLLLAGPDSPVVLHSTSDWTAQIVGARADSDEVSLSWLPQ